MLAHLKIPCTVQIHKYRLVWDQECRDLAQRAADHCTAAGGLQHTNMQVLLSVLTLFDDEIINTCRDRRADMDKMVLEAGVVSGLLNKLSRFILLPAKAEVIVKILQAWYDEVKDYNFSYGGFAMNTGHFTQLVWRDTVKVAFYGFLKVKVGINWKLSPR